MPVTWNPSDKSANITLSNGDLTATVNGTWSSVRATLSKASGKWYWEITIDAAAHHHIVGIATSATPTSTAAGMDSNSYGYYDSVGQKYHSGNGVNYGDAFGVGDIIGTALDLDSGKIWWSKNGVWQASGDPAAGTNEAYSDIFGTFFPMYSLHTNPAAGTANFGDSAFTYTVPSGFTAFAGEVPEPTSGTFYPSVISDDGYWQTGSFVNTGVITYIGNASGQLPNSYIRFQSVIISQGSIIANAFIRFTAYANLSTESVNANIFFNAADNAVAPTSEGEGDALALTAAVPWNGIPAWTQGTEYDTPDISSALQEIISRAGWVDTNAVQVVIKDNNSSIYAHRTQCTYDHAEGVQKAELHVEWGPGPSVETFYPVASSDDGVRSGATGFVTDGTSMLLGMDADVAQKNFIRFPAVTIRQGSRIVKAQLKVIAAATCSTETVTLGHGFVDADNPDAPTTYQEYDALEPASTSSSLSVPSWTDGEQYALPAYTGSYSDLKNLLQEVVDRQGFSSGNAVILLIRGGSSDTDANRSISTIDFNAGSEKPGLYVEYGPEFDITQETFSIGNENPAYIGKGFNNSINSDDVGYSWWAYSLGSYCTTGWVGQDFGGSNNKIVTKYRLYSDNCTESAKTWTFQASTTGAWAGEEVTLDTVTDYAFDADFAWHEWEFSNSDAYRYYRINVTANNGNAGYLVVREFEMEGEDGPSTDDIAVTIPMPQAEGFTGITSELTIPMTTVIMNGSDDLVHTEAFVTIPMMTVEIDQGKQIWGNVTVPMMTARVVERDTVRGNVTVPMMVAELSSGLHADIEVTAPMMSAEGEFGKQCEVTIPMMTVEMEGVVGRTISSNLTLPMMTVEMEGKTAHLINCEVTVPMMRAEAELITGKLIISAVTIPMMEAALTSHEEITGGINVSAPMMEVYMVGKADRAECEILRYLEPVL